MRITIALITYACITTASDCPTKPPTKSSPYTEKRHANGTTSHNPYWHNAYSKISTVEETKLCQKKIDEIESIEERQFLAIHICLTQRKNYQMEMDGYEKRLTKIYINGRPVPKFVYVKKEIS